MNRFLFCRRLVAACTVGLCLTGCSLLKPSGITPRTFVLTAMPANSAIAQAASTNMVVGMKPVRTPGYLFRKSFAMRRDGNEIVYLESVDWAERLDAGLLRVLAADLASLIPTDQVRFSWAPGSVAVEVDVNVERFDVDSRGEGVLTAWWRVLSSDGEKVLASGRFSAVRAGPPPTADPREAATTMSNLAADLAGKLAQTIKGIPPAQETKETVAD